MIQWLSAVLALSAFLGLLYARSRMQEEKPSAPWWHTVRNGSVQVWRRACEESLERSRARRHQ